MRIKHYKINCPDACGFEGEVATIDSEITYCPQCGVGLTEKNVPLIDEEIYD